MAKGIAALAYLPQVDLVLPTGNAAASVEAFRGLANKIAQFQSESRADGTYNAEVAVGNNPFDKSVWNIVISGSGETYTCTFVSEVSSQDLGVGLAALSTRRAVDILKTSTVNNCTMRSFLAVLSFIEQVEDRVAKSGSGATGDATYTAVPVRGSTPFKTYEWTVVKLADLYTLTTTANSN
jgi:hypothetical protein